MERRPSRESISTKQEKIANLAKQNPQMAFTTLAHHIDLAWCHEAYRRTRKSGAVGVDGVTASEYESKLEENLKSMLDRFKSGGYRAPSVRRVYIPKEGARHKTRPIGIPTLEDKVLQRAVAMVLEAVYEQDFLDCSYGFRPGRSPHGALDRLWRGLMGVGGGWVIDLDIQSFFDSVEHAHLRAFLDQRVRDGVIRRAIGKWLNAGVMEEGATWYPEKGTPQGGVISPLLSNIFLHEVLDLWYHEVVQPRLKGRSLMVRFADDAVLVFEREDDARRVLDVLPKRFGKYGLTLHPEKTRLVDFRRPGRPPHGGPGGTFDMLGFTHYWGKSRHGNWVVKRKTAKGRFRRAMTRMNHWCRQSRHLRVATQRAALNRKLRGHYNYYGVTGNYRALARFHHEVQRLWRKWLGRRSRAAPLSWDRFTRLLRHHPLVRPYVPRSVYAAPANP